MLYPPLFRSVTLGTSFRNITTNRPPFTIVTFPKNYYFFFHRRGLPLNFSPLFSLRSVRALLFLNRNQASSTRTALARRFALSE